MSASVGKRNLASGAGLGRSWLNIEARTDSNYVGLSFSSGNSVADLHTSNRAVGSRFRSILDSVTVFGGREELSGRSWLISCDR